MPYSDGSYSMAMPQMSAVGPNGFGDNLPSLANHQSMSARTSRSNSLIRPGSGAEDNRRSISALEFQNSRMNFNDYNPQQNQTPPVPGPNSHYDYGHSTTPNNAMSHQNGMPVKSEGPDSISYGVSSLPNVESMSAGQNGSMWQNGTLNGDPHLLNSSTAGGPYQPKATGVLTGTF